VAPSPQASTTASVPAPPSRDLTHIEQRIGGRLGLYAVDTDSGRELTHRADERFALCSTFKWVLAANVLRQTERGELSLDDSVAYGPGDLLEHAPTTRAHVGEGALTVMALAEAAVTVSDNTAANLLLARIGGPAGLTEYMRSLGDTVTRLDRTEGALNENAPGDPRDTTSPRAMGVLLRRLLVGDALEPASRERLLDWMRATETGKRRLRGGFPADWDVGDKTGGCSRGAVNDVAIAWPPGRAPILVALYLSEGSADFDSLEAAHAEVARLVVRELERGDPAVAQP
jgi:beta-lactamase class A